jgi:hypothetical protein
VRGRTDAVIAVPAQVAVAPVEHPDAVSREVAEAGDREPRPIRSDLGCPRRSALEDRDRPTTHIELDPDLVAQAGRDSSCAVAPDPREVEVGKDGLGRGHGAQQATEPTASRTNTTWSSCESASPGSQRVSAKCARETAPRGLAWPPQARLARLPPAELRGHEPEDALDGVSVVLDSELVRNGQQQRVGGLDRGVAGELLDEDVGLCRYERPKIAFVCASM